MKTDMLSEELIVILYLDNIVELATACSHLEALTSFIAGIYSLSFVSHSSESGV